jgi:hypothetical protein
MPRYVLVNTLIMLQFGLTICKLTSVAAYPDVLRLDEKTSNQMIPKVPHILRVYYNTY